jgi:hypothetical protein
MTETRTTAEPEGFLAARHSSTSTSAITATTHTAVGEISGLGSPSGLEINQPKKYMHESIPNSHTTTEPSMALKRAVEYTT